MAVVSKRVVTIRKMFAALMENGPHIGQKVLIYPYDGAEVHNLTEDQLTMYEGTGSLSVEVADIDDTVEPSEGQIFLDPLP